MAPKDPKTGSYHIGPRVMDPKINRFVGGDQYVAAGANLELQLDPLTGNPYLYAGANPAGMVDDGHHPNECPKNGQCESFDFQPIEGQGDVRIGLFIYPATAAARFAKGDGRTWTSNTNPSNNRIYLDLHLEEGEGFVSAAESCWSWGKCTAARPWSVNRGSLKLNTIHITRGKDGATTVRIRSTISLGPGPAIDASFRIDARGNISWVRDDYPWLEIYRVKDGRISTAERDNPGGWRTANLFRNSRFRKR